MNSPLVLTRRKVLQRAGLVITTAAFPAEAHVAAAIEPLTAGQTPAPAGDHSISQVMRRLTDYMSGARDRVMPETALEQTKWHVLDTFATMVSGSELPPGRAAIDFARAYGGEKVATVAGDTILCGPLEAALAADRSGSGAANPRALGARVGRGQQRSPGHQHSVCDGADADRQDRHLPIDPRQTPDAGSGDSPAARQDAPAGEARGGAGARLPLLEITLADGTRISQDAGPVLGTVQNPMTRDQVVAKCRDLMTPVLGTSRSARLIERVLALETVKDVRDLRPFLQRTYRAGPPSLSSYPMTAR
jgi:hypothetical protein